MGDALWLQCLVALADDSFRAGSEGHKERTKFWQVEPSRKAANES